MNVADACCQGRLVMTLEGGYHIQGQSAAVKKVLQEMRDDRRTEIDQPFPTAWNAGQEDPSIQRAMDQIRPYWPVF